ncbi:MAG TPA: hypothetical protein VFE12_18015 [Acetobacteraceae bacterium]|nr:hypothetical protein [Acetobacteraceae bacterium]
MPRRDAGVVGAIGSLVRGVVLLGCLLTVRSLVRRLLGWLPIPGK